MYQSIPSINDCKSCISKEEAIKQKGFQVILKNQKGGSISFTVTRLFPSNALYVTLLIIFAGVGVASVSGGLYMRYYALPQIGAFLSYPTTNCTVLYSYTAEGAKGSTEYCLDITYNDTNESEQNTSVCGDQFQRLTNGSVFICVLHDNTFVDSYAYIYSQYSSAEDNLYWGYVIPIFSLVLILAILGLGYCLISVGTKYYYASDILVSGNTDYVITDWQDIGTELQQYLYVLMLAYYEFTKRTPPKKTCFSQPKLYRNNWFENFLYGLLCCIVFGPLVGLTIGACFVAVGYIFSQYIGAIVMYTIAFSFIPFCYYTVYFVSSAMFTTGTQERELSYYPIKSHTLKGYI